MIFERTGGPAYPVEISHEGKPGVWQSVGLTILDVFAMEAMKGLLSQHRGSPGETGIADVEPAYMGWSGAHQDQVVQCAFDIAQKMLRERDRRFAKSIDDEE